MRHLFVAVAALAAVLLSGSSSGLAAGAPASGASARAFAIKVLVPGREGGGTPEVTAPGDKVQFGGGFAYPADGSIVTTGPVTASVSASATETAANASATSEVTTIILFGGEVTVAQVTGRATASAKTGQEPVGDLSRAAVSGLTVLGQPAASDAGRVELGDWGYAILRAQGSAVEGDGYRGFVTALDIHLTAEHGGLPVGSEILIGYAEAAAVAAPTPPETTTGGTTMPPPSAQQRGRNRGAGGAKAAARPKPSRVPVGKPLVPPIVRRPLPSLTPKLTEQGYVFPVHGPASFVDTFGAARAVVGWHHGEDIFAPMGAPVLAVAKGTVFSVGWNDVGGNRLWLRDTKGNEFYYAHLSAFSPLAVDGAHVEAGDVLGFVGNSGDAETTPPHLHFEIHPVGLLSLGYDGVINPYEYLLAWRRLQDVHFVAGASWTASVGIAQVSDAPRPGAFLLSSTDISVASGLDPGSLERAMEEPVSAEAATGTAGGAAAPPSTGAVLQP